MSDPIAWFYENADSKSVSLYRDTLPCGAIPLYPMPNELTDKEIIEIMDENINLFIPEYLLPEIINFARAIRNEKVFCNLCNGTLFVCENHPDQEAHECKYCGGAGMPCECTKKASEK